MCVIKKRLVHSGYHAAIFWHAQALTISTVRGSAVAEVPHAALHLLLTHLKIEQDVQYAGKRLVGLCADIFVNAAKRKQHSSILGAQAILELLGDAIVALFCFVATC